MPLPQQKTRHRWRVLSKEAKLVGTQQGKLTQGAMSQSIMDKWGFHELEEEDKPRLHEPL